MSTRDQAIAGGAEPLFTCTMDGRVWEFVTLRERGCALVLDGERVRSGDDSSQAIQGVMDAFLCATRLRDRRVPASNAAPSAGTGTQPHESALYVHEAIVRSNA